MPYLLSTHGGAQVSITSIRRVAAHKNASYAAPNWNEPRFRYPNVDLHDPAKVAREVHENSRLKFNRKRVTIPHLLPTLMGVILSDVVKQLIVEMEPDAAPRHRISVVDHKWRPFPYPYWHYHILDFPAIEALDLEETCVRLKDKPDSLGNIFETGVLFAGHAPVKTFLQGEVVDGRHIFTERRAGKAAETFGWLFVSDEFAVQLRERAATVGLELREIGITRGGVIA